ncbi:acetylxylan esterase [Flavimobilis marinus]|uniref:Cephalosporin-C deacetylase n=1 Tax=Flavimobilis marinus TaxID=285351 RepID=A0A1I2HNZ2_9MICO|nr:acetylxylan esterase [Flavimobilis marinus]GHG57022.1 acetylxylan esterase [Flavimobilis marinus]SFF30446.1 cephalosporin-C deacetylase [Flavimobilis marinus]
MALFDLPRAELERYLPDVAEPADLDAFWARTLQEARTHDLALRVEPVDTGLRLVEVFDVSFAGFGGQPIKAWLTVPAHRSGPLPAVVEYNGYGGGRGLPQGHLAFAAAGYASLFMDTRGQGSQWGDGGGTPDLAGSGPAHPGFLTRGLERPEDHYYRRVFTDAVRAVEAVRALDLVDPARVAVAGASQGGLIALAVAGLVPDLVGVMADVPFGCHFARAVEITDTTPYAEVTKYLAVHRDRAEQTFRTLSYVDGVNLGRRATAPLLSSVALMDTICPPSTVYAAFKHYGTRAGTTPDKTLEVYEFNNHEGGGGHQLARQLPWLHQNMAAAAPVAEAIR